MAEFAYNNAKIQVLAIRFSNLIADIICMFFLRKILIFNQGLA